MRLIRTYEISKTSPRASPLTAGLSTRPPEHPPADTPSKKLGPAEAEVGSTEGVTHSILQPAVVGFGEGAHLPTEIELAAVPCSDLHVSA